MTYVRYGCTGCRQPVKEKNRNYTPVLSIFSCASMSRIPPPGTAVLPSTSAKAYSRERPQTKNAPQSHATQAATITSIFVTTGWDAQTECLQYCVSPVRRRLPWKQHTPNRLSACGAGMARGWGGFVALLPIIHGFGCSNGVAEGTRARREHLYLRQHQQHAIRRRPPLGLQHGRRTSSTWALLLPWQSPPRWRRSLWQQPRILGTAPGCPSGHSVLSATRRVKWVSSALLSKITAPSTVTLKSPFLPGASTSTLVRASRSVSAYACALGSCPHDWQNSILTGTLLAQPDIPSRGTRKFLLNLPTHTSIHRELKKTPSTVVPTHTQPGVVLSRFTHRYTNY